MYPSSAPSEEGADRGALGRATPRRGSDHLRVRGVDESAWPRRCEVVKAARRRTKVTAAVHMDAAGGVDDAGASDRHHVGDPAALCGGREDAPKSREVVWPKRLGTKGECRCGEGGGARAAAGPVDIDIGGIQDHRRYGKSEVARHTSSGVYTRFDARDGAQEGPVE